LESNFAKLSFKGAVQLLQKWGFRVEEGPGHEEVTLILEGPAHRSYYVYEVAELPQIAEVALRVRRNIGATKARQFSLRQYQADGPDPVATNVELTAKAVGGKT
jgi:hypothetical protein